MATKRQATVGGVHEALEILKKNKSVVCGVILGVTTGPRSDEMQCVAVQHGPVEEHAVQLAGILREMANELDPPAG